MQLEVQVQCSQPVRALDGELDLVESAEVSSVSCNKAVRSSIRKLCVCVCVSHNMTVFPLPVGLDTPIRVTPRSSADKHDRMTSS